MRVIPPTNQLSGLAGAVQAERKAKPRLGEGQVVTNWKQALGQLAIAHPDRINPYL